MTTLLIIAGIGFVMTLIGAKMSKKDTVIDCTTATSKNDWRYDRFVKQAGHDRITEG